MSLGSLVSRLLARPGRKLSVGPCGKRQIRRAIDAHLNAIAHERDPERAAAHFRQILDLHKLERLFAERRSFVATLTGHEHKSRATSSIINVLTTSLFLEECAHYLLAGAPEHMHGVTGFSDATAKVETLDRMLLLKADQETRDGVTANGNSVFDCLLYLYESGLSLLGVFHSHRLNGVPQPSGVDLALQARLDRGGYNVIQAIFSDSGHVHFFSSRVTQFRIRVSGKIKVINERTFRLR